jgi:prolyl-tRNA editing enzyme YbaK/EbsC (Cys-tRNA(Pro) deacylase)
MKRRTATATVIEVGMALAALSALGQNAATHLVWMDDAGEAQEELRAAIHDKAGADAARAASRIEDLMAKTQAYWDVKHEPEAVRMAQDARARARQVAAAASAGKLDEADEAFVRMVTSCTACHGLHLEKG